MYIVDNPTDWEVKHCFDIKRVSRGVQIDKNDRVSDYKIYELEPDHLQKGKGKIVHPISACMPKNPNLTSEYREELCGFAKSIATWSWFGHFTYRGFPSEKKAIRSFRSFLQDLSTEVYEDPRYYRHHKGVGWIRGFEYQERGAIHFHALIAGVPDRVQRFDYINKWYAQYSGMCRIYAYDPRKGAEYYMTKYVLKGGQIDLGEELRPLS